MNKNEKIVVTGASGFVGKNLINKLNDEGYKYIESLSSKDVDLTSQKAVSEFFSDNRFDYCFHLAGTVGGIQANINNPVKFFYDNLMMGVNVIDACWKSGVKKIVAAGAGCGYPESAKNPISEDFYWDGFPQIDSAPYSLAKRMLNVHSIALKKQYDYDLVIGIPGNVYGAYDNFNLTDAHVIPALVRKFVETADDVEVWGDGSPTRDFVHVDDVVNGLIFLCHHGKGGEIYNISSGEEHSIKDVVNIIANKLSFKGQIIWQSHKPSGQKRRLFDISKIKALGFSPSIKIEEGLGRTIDWYSENQDLARK